MTTLDMLEAAPQQLTVDAQLIADAIDAASACAVVCTACASACLSEGGDMAQCVRDDLDCADLCEVTAKHLARLNRGDKQLTLSILATCIEACAQCAGSCQAHAEHHDHCKLCAQACQRCAQACQALVDTLKAV